VILGRLLGLLLLAACAAVALRSEEARGGEWTRADSNAYRRAARSPWHGAYYNTQTGRPTAVVVPPTARMQSSYNWGVAQTRSTPIYHQYGRAYPGVAAPAGLPFQPTPRWPSSTEQHGYYYVRGPW
jgi:hypothetical protein